MDSQEAGALEQGANDPTQGAGSQENGGGGGEGTLLAGAAGEAQNQANSEAITPGADQQTPQQAAPGSYEPFQIPEDATNIAPNDEVMTGFGDLARELNLSQEQAQKVVEFGARSMHKAIGDGMEAIRAQMEEVKAKWHREASEDPAIKTDLNYALRAVKRFDTDGAVSKMFDETGVGSHPAMIRFMIEIGKATGEAPLHTQGAGTGGGAQDLKTIANDVFGGKM